MARKIEPVEVYCPRCGRTQIVYLPKERIPVCPVDRIEMVIRELLDEGKSY